MVMSNPPVKFLKYMFPTRACLSHGDSNNVSLSVYAALQDARILPMALLKVWAVKKSLY